MINSHSPTKNRERETESEQGGRQLEGTGDWKSLALVVKHGRLGEFSWMRVAKKGSKTISLKDNQTF